MPTYNPAKVTISVGSKIVILRGESVFVKASRNKDAVGLKMSSDGIGTRVIDPDHSGRIEVTLVGSSPSNDDFQEIAQQDEDTNDGVVPVTVEDTTGTALASCQQGWVVKIPDLEKAKEMGEVTWIIETDNLELVQGGTTSP